jgi:alginate O-acetyltransferase complex protein AlgJ
LAEQLSFELGAPVDKLAVNAGGAFGARERLLEELSSGTDRLAGKRLVIWQFAERELAVGDWKLLSLP